MSERVHDEFCFNTDLYQDDVEGYMCICNRLDSARHQAKKDERELAAARVAAVVPMLTDSGLDVGLIVRNVAVAAARGEN